MIFLFLFILDGSTAKDCGPIPRLAPKESPPATLRELLVFCDRFLLPVLPVSVCLEPEPALLPDVPLAPEPPVLAP